jgi:hypothetical protein
VVVVAAATDTVPAVANKLVAVDTELAAAGVPLAVVGTVLVVVVNVPAFSDLPVPSFATCPALVALVVATLAVCLLLDPPSEVVPFAARASLALEHVHLFRLGIGKMDCPWDSDGTM